MVKPLCFTVDTFLFTLGLEYREYLPKHKRDDSHDEGVQTEGNPPSIDPRIISAFKSHLPQFNFENAKIHTTDGAWKLAGHMKSEYKQYINKGPIQTQLKLFFETYNYLSQYDSNVTISIRDGVSVVRVDDADRYYIEEYEDKLNIYTNQKGTWLIRNVTSDYRIKDDGNELKVYLELKNDRIEPLIPLINNELGEREKTVPDPYKIIDLRQNLGWIYRGDSEKTKGTSNPIYWIKKLNRTEYRIMRMRAKDIWFFIRIERGLIENVTSNLTKEKHKEEWVKLTGCKPQTHSIYAKSLEEKGFILKDSAFNKSVIGDYLITSIDIDESITIRLNATKRLRGIVRNSLQEVGKYYSVPYVLSIINDHLRFTRADDDYSHPENVLNFEKEREIFEMIFEVYQGIWTWILYVEKDFDWVHENPHHIEELWNLFRTDGWSEAYNDYDWDLIQIRVKRVSRILQWYLEQYYGGTNEIPQNEFGIIMRGYYLGEDAHNTCAHLVNRLIKEKRLSVNDYLKMEESLSETIRSLDQSHEGNSSSFSCFENTYSLLQDTIYELQRNPV